MSEDIVNNNPKKELLYTLGGIALFLGIVLLIGISGLMRPAGEHIKAETTAASAAADKAEAIAAEDDAAPADAAAATTEEADAAATDTDTAAADATVTPATDGDNAVVAAESGTATTTGTVNQAAVGDVDLTAEQADADADAGDTADQAATAQ